jgi:hypothetical protein
VTPEVVSKIRRWLRRGTGAKVLKDTRTATGWVRAAIKRIVQEQPNG